MSAPTEFKNVTAVAKANERLFKLETFDKKVVKVALGRKPEEKKLKPPAPVNLGSVTDLLKKDEKKDGEAKKDDKPLAPEFETIPAGPVFAFIAHSEASAPVNALMQKRAYQISDYTFTGLPQKADELFEPACERRQGALDGLAHPWGHRRVVGFGTAGVAERDLRHKPQEGIEPAVVLFDAGDEQKVDRPPASRGDTCGTQ